jgi:hypothetical protein
MQCAEQGPVTSVARKKGLVFTFADKNYCNFLNLMCQLLVNANIKIYVSGYAKINSSAFLSVICFWMKVQNNHKPSIILNSNHSFLFLETQNYLNKRFCK